MTKAKNTGEVVAKITDKYGDERDCRPRPQGNRVMTTLDDLIERVEKATGPDRELDVDILLTTEPETYSLQHGKLCIRANGYVYFVQERERRNYTASLDAALTLARTRAELALALQAAYHAALTAIKGSSQSTPETWPAIQAALSAALRARRGE